MAVYGIFFPLAFQFLQSSLSGGLTLSGHQVHIKDVLFLSSSAGQWRENIKNSQDKKRK